MTNGYEPINPYLVGYDIQGRMAGLSEDAIAWVQKYGLTKREYFAAMAMQGLLSVPTMQDDINVYGTMAAKASVMMADLLIEQLNKQP